LLQGLDILILAVIPEDVIGTIRMETGEMLLVRKAAVVLVIDRPVSGTSE
jgi:hypothetical protein